VPPTEAECSALLTSMEARLGDARSKFEELAASRTGDDKLRKGVVELLMQWFVHGRGPARGA